MCSTCMHNGNKEDNMIVNFVEITLYSGEIETIDNLSIESVSSQNRAKIEPNKPTFGIIAGGGNLIFKDIDKKFVTYSRQGAVGADNKVVIYIKNTITGKQQVVGTWTTEKWDYDVDDNTMSVTLRDDIQDLQEIEVNDTAAYIELTNNPMTALQLYNYIREITPARYEFENLSEDVSELLSSINITYAYLEAGSLWGYYEDICQLALLYMYKTPNGKIKLDIIR